MRSMEPTKKRPEWKQDFPTYTFESDEAVLHEYDFAARLLESEEHVFMNASNLIAAAATILGALTLGTLDTMILAPESFFPLTFVLWGLVAALAVLSIASLMYLAQRHRSLVLASRKVIVLRRMLGVSYGPMDLVLPSNRVEGADNPFEIRFFPGWASQVAYPFWIVGVFSILLMVRLFGELLTKTKLPFSLIDQEPWHYALGAGFVWAILLAIIYRWALFEKYESWLLVSTVFLSRILNVDLVPNIEYVIYRANLATYEVARHNVDLSLLKQVAVFIEDEGFYSHRGISPRGIVRALLGTVGLRARSGGSTITMQLARTLFIQDYQKTVRRKILEFPLAIWLERQFDKHEILERYLAAVRYDQGVNGILAAMKHFFDLTMAKPSRSVSFVLVERVSVVGSVLMPSKVAKTLRRSVRKGLLSPQDAEDVIDIYRALIENNKIANATQDDIHRLMISYRAE